MTFTNHLLTGAVIAKVLPLPIAIPLAFVSHFVLDSLPHFGFATRAELMKRRALFGSVVVIDFIAAVILATWLIRAGHYSWLLVGLVAYSPDVFWIYRFTIEEKFGKREPTKGNRFIQFHRGIQKYERTWGAAVELAYAAGMLLIVRP